MIHYQCPACQAVHASVELLAGMTVICKKCKQPIEVPKESTAPPAVSEAPAAAPSKPQPVAAIGPTAAEPSVAAPIAASPRRPSRLWLFLLAGVLALLVGYLVWMSLRTPPVRVLKGHDGPVWCVAYSPDGRYVVSGGADAVLILWNADNGSELSRFEGHADTVACVVFSRDGRYLLSGSFDKTLRLWEVATGSLFATYSGHQWAVTGVALAANNQLAVSAGADQTLRMWDIPGNKEEARVQPGKLRLGDKTLDQVLRSLGRFPIDGAAFTSVHLMPDERGIVATNMNRSVTLWNEKGEKQRDLAVLPAPALCCAISRDGQFLLAGGGSYDQPKPGDFDLQLWDIPAGKKRASFAGHTDCVTSVAFSTNGKRALSASRDHTVRLWNVEARTEVRTFEGHGDIVTGVAFSPAGHRALSGSFDGTVRLWRLPE